MGKRGAPSKHPSGVGYTTKQGYHRLSLWNTATKSTRLVFAHVLVWEEAHGPVPEGHCLHHRNGDKQDNRLENLQLVTHLEHKRIESGCQLRDGVWWKPCSICGEFKPIDHDHWYFTAEGYPGHGRCKPCHIRRVVADKQRRRQRRRENA